MILPEFKSADTLPELIMAAIRSVNGLLFAAPFYIIAVLGFFLFRQGIVQCWENTLKNTLKAVKFTAAARIAVRITESSTEHMDA